MVELVHDDVVEGVAREALQVGDAAERLDRREEDVGVRFPLLAHVEAQAGLGPDPAEGVARRLRIPRTLRVLGMTARRYSGRWESKALSQVLPRPVARTTRPAMLPCALVSSRALRASCWMAWGVGIVVGSSGTSTGPSVFFASGVGRRCR